MSSELLLPQQNSKSSTRNTSSGARAMHGFGAEVFIEEVRKCNDMMIYSTGVSFLATILNPWFLSLFEIHAASSKFDTKHLPRLPRTSATRAKKVCADIIRSHSLCCRSEGHRAVVVVATICAVFTWTLIWIWSLSQQKESWFLKQFAYPWRVEPYICGAWATISSLKRVIARLQVLDWFYCEYHQVFVNGRSLHLTLGVAHCFTLIWVVSVAHFPGHLFLTAQNHGAECSLSRTLPRPSHFIVRDNDQLRYSAPLLCWFQ